MITMIKRIKRISPWWEVNITRINDSNDHSYLEEAKYILGETKTTVLHSIHLSRWCFTDTDIEYLVAIYSDITGKKDFVTIILKDPNWTKDQCKLAEKQSNNSFILKDKLSELQQKENDKWFKMVNATFFAKRKR